MLKLPNLKLLAAVSLAALAAPAFADSAVLPIAAPPSPSQLAADGVPDQLTPAQRASYAGVFAALHDQRWSDAAAGLDGMDDGLLHPIARAELFLAKGSPRIDLQPILDLLTRAPEMPEAARLGLLARKRGAATLPDVPLERDLVSYRGAPARRAAATTASDAAAAMLVPQLTPLLKTDQPAAAEARLTPALDQLSPEARTEWQQRIAWSYYLNGDDASAERLAALARVGTGEWAPQADWVAGLAAWRANDCKGAGDAFGAVASRARDDEMRAAGLFWAARADMACGRPQMVQPRLRSAARLPETFYGLLASRVLGLAPAQRTLEPDLASSEWSRIGGYPNIRAAAALAEIGEYGLADETIRHQAKIGNDGDHDALLHLAARLDLPATQIWLAHNAPAGERPEMAARYPVPKWSPQGGWRIEKELVFAHALQESQFRTDAVSPAGARGLMQVLPSTADLIEKQRGGQPVAKTALANPQVNMAYAQDYLQQLAAKDATGGLLPKVIAAYNAGPGNVVKWNLLGRNNGDPLLYIESIPFRETREYVAAVLRNYWMYDQQTGNAPTSLTAIAQGLWPRFPTLSGKTISLAGSSSGAGN